LIDRKWKEAIQIRKEKLKMTRAGAFNAHTLMTMFSVPNIPPNLKDHVMSTPADKSVH
jgi:hypothetical protein